MGMALAFGAFLAVGAYAVGANAVGWLATGVFALGWRAAAGFAAYARTFAEIPTRHNKLAVARAFHTRDAMARDFFAHSWFFTWTRNCFHVFQEHTFWFLFPFSLLFLAMVGNMLVKARRLSSAPA